MVTEPLGLLIIQLPCCGTSGLFLLIGLAMAYTGATRYLLVQKIENTPTSKVRSAAVGLVELYGAAKCISDMAAPISKAKSAYWSVKAEYYQQSGKHSKWQGFFSESSSSRFYLEDDTGKMLVDPAQGEIYIPSDFSWTGHLSDKGFFGLLPQKQLDEKVLAYLDENPRAKAAFNSHGGHNLRVLEYVIAEDDRIYVLGTAEPTEGSVKSELAHENLIVRKSKTDKILFISDSEEKKILGGMKLTAIGTLIVGIVLSVGSGLVFFGTIGYLLLLLGM